MTERIFITGGKGTTGVRIARLLEAANIPVSLGTRHPTAPTDMRFDWTDLASATAFEGCSAAYLVAPTDRIDHLALMQPILERAMARGTRRFVLLSSSQLAPGGPMMGKVHAWLATNVPEWAVLRPSWFMENFSHGPHAPTIREENAIFSATGTGRVGFISADDIAKSAVAALTAETPLNDDAILTGPEALSYDDVARLISEILSRPIRHVKLETGELVQRHMSLGLPRGYAETLSHLDEIIRADAEDRTTDAVLRLTGQAPTRFRTFAESNSHLWQ